MKIKAESQFQMVHLSLQSNSPLGKGHLDIVARQQRSVRELKLKHFSFVIFILIIWARRVSKDVIDTAVFSGF